jgi:hypothetical protein
MNKEQSLRLIRLLLVLFVIALVISGATAIPLRFELSILDSVVGQGTAIARIWPAMGMWVSRVYDALEEMSSKHAFLAYGYDWLAFGHFAIAVFFLGAIHDPIRNRWVVEAGMIACILVIPYALVFGQIRGIPIGWRLIDTLFGIIGILPLWYVRRQLVRLEMSNDGAERST